MSNNILPIFTSHYSVGRSLLTTDEADEYKENSPKSIFTLAQKYGLKDVYVVDNSISGFVSLYQNAKKSKLNLIYGLKLTCCNDILDKSEESLATEHEIIVWLLNTKDSGKDIYRLSTKAATDGFYYQARICPKSLKESMTENLTISIPYYSSFLAKNLLTFSKCVFNPTEFNCTFFVEPLHNLPFDGLIGDAVLKFCGNKFEMINTHTIYYEKKADFLAYQVRRTIAKRSTLECPNLDFFSSDSFCLESIFP